MEVKDGGMGDEFGSEPDVSMWIGREGAVGSSAVTGGAPVVVVSDSSSESIAESPSTSRSSMDPLFDSVVNAAADSASCCNIQIKTRACHQSGLLTKDSVISTGFVS